MFFIKVFLKIAGEEPDSENSENVQKTAPANIQKSVNDVIAEDKYRDKDAGTPFSSQFDAFFRKTCSSQVYHLSLQND